MSETTKKGKSLRSGYRESGHPKVPAEWYVEDLQASRDLFAAEPLQGTIYDPACGQGNILKSANAAGLFAEGSDIAFRGVDRAQRFDFLSGAATLPMAHHVVSNPPFTVTERFVDMALACYPGKVCMFQRLKWAEGLNEGVRADWFRRTGLSHIWVHGRRVSLAPNGKPLKIKRDGTPQGGSEAFAWFVWRRTPVGHTPTVGWLP